MQNNAQISIETITPRAAKTLLLNQITGQRPIRERYVEKLAYEMLEGRFKLSPDAIVLVKDHLANGQHRLSAVVESQVPCQFLVLRTDDESLYKIMDCGIKRTVADVFHGVSNACLVAAAASLVVRYDDRSISLTGNAAASRSASVEYIETHKTTLETAARLALECCRKQRLLPTSHGTALLELTNRTANDRGREFLEQLISGDQMIRPVKLLRERLIKDRITRARLPKAYLFALLIKSYNAFVTGKDLQILKVGSDEDFPRIIEQNAA